MARPDLLLLHAPSVYDFRERFAMYGPISDVIPSTPVFEMYPIGFASIVSYLEGHGYRTRIINLAVKMLRDPLFDAEELISRLNPAAFGLDLHWLVHAAGSLDVAALIKKHHPHTPVILGGLSATYYHKEIVERYPQVDYVLRGDSTEKPLLDLMGRIEAGRAPDDVENLTWRDVEGRKHVNPLTHVPDSLDEASIDYGDMVRLVLRHRDLGGSLPYEGFMDYPLPALLFCKGCLYDCTVCGGASSAFSRFFGRERLALKSPERLVEEMAVVGDYFNGPIFLIGDLRQGGERYAEAVLDRIREEGIGNTVTMELFDAAPRAYLGRIAGSCESFTLEVSPDTHDDAVRRLAGKPYTNSAMEGTIEDALALGCEKFDIFFMVGLPGQTAGSTLESVEYSRRLLERLDGEGRIHPFVAPMSPFLDPGSPAFEHPERHGYRRLLSSLAEHREALLQPCWKLYLNYETRWMSRDEIAEATYEAMIRMTEVKRSLGVMDPVRAEMVAGGLSLARRVMRRIDAIAASSQSEADKLRLYGELRSEAERAGRLTDEAKGDLKAPCSSGVRATGVLKNLLGLSRRL